MKRFFTILLVLTAFSAAAQHTLKLKSGTYQLAEGSFLQLNASKVTYGVALWDRHVLAEDKKALADLGVELFHYLPENSFEVRIPKGVTSEQLKTAGVSSFTAWTPRMKLDGPICNTNFPQWAVLNDGRVAVQFYTAPEFNTLPSYLKLVTDLNDGWYSGVLTSSKLEDLAKNEFVLFIQAIEEPGSAENDNSRAASRVAFMQRDQGFDGTNVVVGLGDDGDIGPHDDYRGRLTSLGGTSIGDHGDHVAGTIFGAGNIDPDGAGSATGATMIYYDYPSNLSNIDSHYNLYGIRVTNSSYSNGCNAGYTSYAQQMDKDIIDNVALMHVFSAGNSNGSNCNYGAGSQWGNVTGGHKQGKNVVATANLTSLDVIAGSSSRGPAADGRIKPDLAAVGTNVYSTIDGHTYGLKTGTSMSAPGVAGFFSVLHNAFDELQSDTAKGGLLKGIAMNTADDLGNNGPDYIYGYGRVNARRAIRVIKDTLFFTSTASTGDTTTFNITLPNGVESFRTMLYWTDKEGSLFASKALVNNLDFLVTDLTNNISYQPWVLNPAANATTLNNNAVRGLDSLNNAEQVTIMNPSAGDYSLTVYGTNIPTGPQEFFVIYDMEVAEVALVYPHDHAPMTPGATVVRWDGKTTGLTWQFSSDHGANWSSLSLSTISNRPMANWTVPNNPTDGAYLRVISGTDTSTAGPFTIMQQPTGLTLDWVCPDSLKITISPVTSATDYTAYILGTKYMDSVYTDSINSMVIPYSPTVDTWISGSGNFNGAPGKRAYAIELPAGTFGCPLARDASLTEIINPQLVSSCQSQVIDITVLLTNPSTSSVDTIPVAYSFNGSTVRDTLFASLLPYADSAFVFSTPIIWSGTSNQNITAWSEMSGDMNALNDTIFQNITYLNSVLYSMPFVQSFDSYNSCPVSTNCGGTACSLGGNWKNLTNGSEDDIDWRTNQGGTASSGTGPGSDFGGSGKYLYLEASGNCEFQEAILYSPCVDLGSSVAPELDFAYHMFGPSTGTLTVEVFDGTFWTEVFKKSGNQGNNWMSQNIDLAPYIGDTIIIRVIGVTGGGYQSDIAIDQFSIEDQIGIPIADFNASTTTPCLNTSLILTDQSAKSPSNWNWSISPSSHTFVNSTTSSSQNPEVSFSSYGAYTITLVATNSYGSDTIVKVNEVTVTSLQGLPIVETFTGNSASDFVTINPDGQTTWTTTDIDGPTGAKSGAVYMGYFNYSTTGEVDILESPKFDITGYSQPTLLFDVSYAQYSTQYFDELAVLVSEDCGSSYDTLYIKGGTNLATTSPTTTVYIPSSPADWRTDTVSLSALNSDLVQFQILGICGYGNNLYLDNIRVIDLAGTASLATLNMPSVICEDEFFTFSLNTTDTTLDGNFTLNRTGSSLTSTFQGMGTHTTQLTSSSDYNLEYVYYNAYTFVADSVILTPAPQLNAAYTLSLAGGLTYDFTDVSTPIPTAWAWDFGDGNTSSQQSPSHTYASTGNYTVQLTVTTDCGIKSTSTTFNNIGLDENGLENAVFYPNPTEDILNIALGQNEGSAVIEIYDVLGALVSVSEYANVSSGIRLDLSSLPSGVYRVSLRTNHRSTSQSISKI